MSWNLDTYRSKTGTVQKSYQSVNSVIYALDWKLIEWYDTSTLGLSYNVYMNLLQG